MFDVTADGTNVFLISEGVARLHLTAAVEVSPKSHLTSLSAR